MLNAIALFARIYWGPDPESCGQLLAGTFLEPLEVLGDLLEYNPAGLLEELKADLTRFEDADALFEHLEAAYIRLFINNRTGGIIPLYASCHAGGQTNEASAPLMGPAAVEMKKRFESQGVSLGNDVREPPDHISIELEYLYFLLEKGWRGQERKLLDEAAVFAAEVMQPWVSALNIRLANEKKCRFYPLVTSILVSMLANLGRLKPLA